MNFRSQPAPNPAFAKATWWVSQISPKMIRCHLWRDIRGQGLVHRVSVTTVVKPHSPALGPVLLRPDHFSIRSRRRTSMGWEPICAQRTLFLAT